jgi:hypothetical protein
MLYLKKQGGTRSSTLSSLATEVLDICHRHKICLLPSHLPGLGNTKSDALSRQKTQDEWYLNPKVAHKIFSKLGEPQIDLFASYKTAQVPTYFTLDRHDQSALGVDALANSWGFNTMYAFPPPSLILSTIQNSRGDTYPDSPILEGGSLVPRSNISPIQTTSEVAISSESGSQYQNRQPSPIPQPPPLDGLATFKAIIIKTGISNEVAEFLSTSWRKSTSGQYKSVWKSWASWCEAKGLDNASISVDKLLEYLLYLFKDRNLSWSSIGVHRSALSSILQPSISPSLGEHPLVIRFMKSIFLRKPPSIQPRWSWDMATVLRYLKRLGSPQSLSLKTLTWKLAFMTATFCAKRISDLTLLRTSKKYLQMTRHAAVFQPAFGAKQDRPGHQSPVVVLRAHSDKSLCPVSHLTEYLSRTNYKNRDEALFLTIIPPHKTAAKATIKRWVLQILREAGINSSPGSTRAAAASYALARNISLNAIMGAADWSQSTTMFKHYIRLLPQEVLSQIARQSSRNVQTAVLDSL